MIYGDCYRTQTSNVAVKQGSRLTSRSIKRGVTGEFVNLREVNRPVGKKGFSGEARRVGTQVVRFDSQGSVEDCYVGSWHAKQLDFTFQEFLNFAGYTIRAQVHYVESQLACTSLGSQRWGMIRLQL